MGTHTWDRMNSARRNGRRMKTEEEYREREKMDEERRNLT
jgi:hypothetical protein